jgi:hemolysin activation/secretion protein
MMNKHQGFFVAVVTVTTSMYAFSDVAYAVTVPSSAQPGVVIRGFEGEKRAPSRLDDTITFSGEKDIAKGASAKKAFTLNKVILEGSTVYNQADIDALAKDSLGASVSFADLDALARSITRKYRADGYVFSSALLPPQKIKDGVVVMRAVEGRITNVVLEGNFKDDNNLIRDLAEKIKAAGPSNTKDIERYLLLIDDLPGIKARSVVKPSVTPGGGDLVITVEQDDFEGSASIDNRGSDYLGPYRGTLIGAANSLFGIHDRTTVRGILTSQTSELRFADVTHEEQLGTEGFRLKGRFAVTRTEPGEELKAFDLKGNSHLFDLEGMYPILRGRQYNVNLLSGFTALNSETEISSITTAEDRVRSVRAGGQFDFTDALAGVNQFELLLTHGLDGLGATDDGAGRSRTNGEHSFFRTNLTATRIQELGGNFSAQLSAAGQYSPDALLASEEFTVGGPEYGRAYDSGEIAGDRGVSGSLELRYTSDPFADFIKSQQFYVFYDAGKVWNKDAVVGEYSSASLASAGLGVRFNLEQDVYGYVELDTPLTRNVNSEHDDDSRIFFSLLKRF